MQYSCIENLEFVCIKGRVDVKMTIYVDILFLENLILNTIILYASTIILNSKPKHFRILVASCLGAIYVVIFYIFKIKIYIDIVAKLMLAICMVYIVYRPNKVMDLIKYVVIFFLVSFVFGGASLGLIYIVNSNNVTIQNGIIHGAYTVKTIFLGVIIAFIIIILSFKLVKSKLTKKDMFCKIKINIEGKEIETKAMLDTGNLLKEPITNIPVVIVENTVLKDALPKELLENTENILGGDIEKIPNEIKDIYLPKVKVIPFSSLGKQNGMLLGIKADSITVVKEEGKKEIDKIIIGIYSKPLSKRGEYKALLGIDVRFIKNVQIKLIIKNTSCH